MARWTGSSCSAFAPPPLAPHACRPSPPPTPPARLSELDLRGGPCSSHQDVVKSDPPNAHVERIVLRTVHWFRKHSPIHDVVVDREMWRLHLQFLKDTRFPKGAERRSSEEMGREGVAGELRAVQHQEAMPRLSKKRRQQ